MEEEIFFLILFLTQFLSQMDFVSFYEWLCKEHKEFPDILYIIANGEGVKLSS